MHVHLVRGAEGVRNTRVYMTARTGQVSLFNLLGCGLLMLRYSALYRT